MTTAAARRAVVVDIRTHHAGVSERRACAYPGFGRSSQRYRSRRARDEELRARLRGHAEARPRWGYRRLHVLLERDGLAVNHKRVYRLYREEGLAVRRRKRKRLAVTRQPMPAPAQLNERWSMDFMHDALVNGRRYRILNVVDDLSREGLASEVDFSLPAARVIQTLEEIALERGFPKSIVLDNGPEFRSTALDAWAFRRQIVLDFIEPGKPTQNPFAESYNGKMRDECLNQHWFRDIIEARTTIDSHQQDHNEVRPHSSLGNLTPCEFARALQGREPGIAVA